MTKISRFFLYANPFIFLFNAIVAVTESNGHAMLGWLVALIYSIGVILSIKYEKV